MPRRSLSILSGEISLGLPRPIRHASSARIQQHFARRLVGLELFEGRTEYVEAHGPGDHRRRVYPEYKKDNGLFDTR